MVDRRKMIPNNGGNTMANRGKWREIGGQVWGKIVEITGKLENIYGKTIGKAIEHFARWAKIDFARWAKSQMEKLIGKMIGPPKNGLAQNQMAKNQWAQ